jgi:hypothetical protein
VTRVSLKRNANSAKADVGYYRCLISSKMRKVSASVGRSHSSEEVSVMDMERRALVIWSYYFKQPLSINGMMAEEQTKSFPVSKRMVHNSYLKVMSKNGCAGIDGQSIEKFNVNMSKKPVQDLQSNGLG